MYDVIIAGGGLAGLTSAILLSKRKFKVLLLEKNHYPHHKVCGEYVSNEVLPFLQKINASPDALFPARIGKFILSDVKGNSLQLPLDLGGFGISRHAFDHHLYRVAMENGTVDGSGNKIYNILFKGADDGFTVETENKVFKSKAVIGAFGKRSNLDNVMQRAFLQKRSPYLAVKYHVKCDLDEDTIALHNFEGGYCGINKIEKDLYCLCYIIHRDKVKKAGGVSEVEDIYLLKNPFLEHIFNSCQFEYEKPEVINEISFELKPAVENHVLMAGDAAGMVSPVFGNGMAMAIRAGKIAAECTSEFLDGKISRAMAEREYARCWNNTFAFRIRTGRVVQILFGNNSRTSLALKMGKQFPFVTRWLMKKSHGEVF